MSFCPCPDRVAGAELWPLLSRCPVLRPMEASAHGSLALGLGLRLRCSALPAVGCVLQRTHTGPTLASRHPLYCLGGLWVVGLQWLVAVWVWALTLSWTRQYTISLRGVSVPGSAIPETDFMAACPVSAWTSGLVARPLYPPTLCVGSCCSGVS